MDIKQHYRRARRIYRNKGVISLAKKMGEFLQTKSRLYFYIFGDDRECPICGTTCRKFLPVKSGAPGENIRRDSQCPGCGSKERHRVMWLYLQNETDLFSRSHTVLHIAPSRSLKPYFQRIEMIKYITMDLQGIDVDLKGDITNMPFSDGSVDVLLCQRVLEHVPDDHSALTEIRRVLDSDGWGIIQVPIDKSRAETFEDPNIISPERREELFGQPSHVRVYGRDYLSRLETAGFRVERTPYVNAFDENRQRRMGLPSDEAIYRCNPQT